MLRPFIGSPSGLLWDQVSECCVHVGIPTTVRRLHVATIYRAETCSLHTINYVFDVHGFNL